MAKIEYEEGPGESEPTPQEIKPPKKRRVTQANELGWYLFYFAVVMIGAILVGVVIDYREGIWEWVDGLTVSFTRWLKGGGQ